jgi:hypothetical protein
MNRRQFVQSAAGGLGSALVVHSAQPVKGVPADTVNTFPGDWKRVPSTLVQFDWHRTIAHPRSSPGLTNWCMLDQNPESKEILLSFCEITDPTGKFKNDPPRYDFSQLRRVQRFLISRDRGESWQGFVDHPIESREDAWQLNGIWHRVKFLSGGLLLGLMNEHTQKGKRPMVFWGHSKDMGRTWSSWHALSNDPNRGMYGGDLCQFGENRWIYFYEVFDMRLPFFKRRIRRRPPVWLESPTSTRRFGCAISEDGGISWTDRPDLDISVEAGLNTGEPFEPAVIQLPNEYLLVAVRRHRMAAFGGEGLPWYQWILEPTSSGFKIVSQQECHADISLGPTGHPKLVRTRDGIALAIRSDGLWASVSNGDYWEKMDSQYLGYYPQGIELDDGSLLVAGHLGGDDYWPPDRDQEVRLTKLRLDRRPILRNLNHSIAQGFKLDEQVHRDVRVRCRLGTDASAGVLVRASLSQGNLSGYVFYVTAHTPSWVLGRMENGKLTMIATGKLSGLGLTRVRPHLELAAVGDLVRAFVDTYPVASGKDSVFKEGRCGLLVERGRVKVESYEVSSSVTLQDIGGEKVELVDDLGAMGYSQAADNWQKL